MNKLLTKNDFIGFEITQIVAGQHGKGTNKKLEFVCKPVNNEVWYRIYNDKKIIGSSISFHQAIAIYNEVE